jgi:hypothetical protein
MSITVYTLIIGVCYVAVGLAMTIGRVRFAKFLQTFCRNKYAGMALSTIALIFTYSLLKSMPMGFLDHYKWLLIPLLPVAIVLVNIYLNELLFSRSLGGLLLILMAPVLDAARISFSTFTPVLSLACYILIVIGMYLVCLPYLMRDFGTMIERYSGKTKLLSLFVLIFGILLIGIAFVL